MNSASCFKNGVRAMKRQEGRGEGGDEVNKPEQNE